LRRDDLVRVDVVDGQGDHAGGKCCELSHWFFPYSRQGTQVSRCICLLLNFVIYCAIIFRRK
jgi:hypothetical protein